MTIALFAAAALFVLAWTIWILTSTESRQILADWEAEQDQARALQKEYH